MKTVLDVKMRDVDFSGYLLDFRTSLNIPAIRNVKVGEFIRMFEFNKEANIVTGRNLLFEITFIDESPGLIGIGNLWLINLRKNRP